MSKTKTPTSKKIERAHPGKRNGRPVFDYEGPGKCWVCGCTENRACPGGCAWTGPTRTLCTSCVEMAEALRRLKDAVTNLHKRTNVSMETFIPSFDAWNRTETGLFLDDQAHQQKENT